MRPEVKVSNQPVYIGLRKLPFLWAVLMLALALLLIFSMAEVVWILAISEQIRS